METCFEDERVSVSSEIVVNGGEESNERRGDSRCDAIR